MSDVAARRVQTPPYLPIDEQPPPQPPLVTQVELRGALRSMLLPVAPQREEQVIDAAAQALAKTGVLDEDRGLWVLLEVDRWRESGKPSRGLAVLVRACLRAGDEAHGDALAKDYFQLHSALTAEPLFDHDRASAFLSHTRLMASLAAEERLSAAQVARVVAARDQRLPVSWELVNNVLRALGLVPRLTQDEMEALFFSDSEEEQKLFADAGADECARLIGEVGERVGYPSDLAGELLMLAPPGGHVHGPYLQMLHYLCVIAEWHDHALSVLYEFEPRSETGPPKWLYDRYPAALHVRKNPFLNNAKGVERLDRAWAWPRQASAHALVSIVQGLESLGFSARQDLAAWIRRWLCRQIRLARGTEAVLPVTLSRRQRQALLVAAAGENTRSSGIIEQRLVDALVTLLHPRESWIARGLGDPVNASNFSRRKCGDVDFQDTARRLVVAYEAHGGALTDVYVEGHCRTLRPTLAARREEWDANVAANEAWSVEVVYVAHGLALSQDITAYGFSEGETEVGFRAVTYASLIEEASSASSEPEVAASVEEHLVAVMADERTPDRARKRLLELIGV